MPEKLILWTGGWDSTYRVLDLVINHKVSVKPYYLVDHERAAAQIEMETMQKIRLLLEQEFPNDAARLFPVEIFSRVEIPENAEISAAYRALISRQHVGSQYDWLARFCAHRGIQDIELSIDKDIKVRTKLSGARAALANAATPIQTETGISYKIGEAESDSDEYRLFKYFTFPLFDTTKAEMGAKARQSGFIHILEQSWFCHFPINSKACGRCPPCRATVEKGMGHRLPAASRYVRYPLRKAEKRLLESLPPAVVVKLKQMKASLI